MNPSVAGLIYTCGIAGLFYLGRGKPGCTSKALWLPVIYLWIIGSRPISAWLGVTPQGGNVQVDGSPLDAFVSGLLLLGAIIVLVRRGRRARTLVISSWSILIYFFYCLISTGWAYYPDIALKKWVRSLGDLAMVLVIVTDPQPVLALRRLSSRLGFLLLPASVLFIKYYRNLGVAYAPDGQLLNTGVATDKNLLGLMVLLISLGTLWNLWWLITNRNEPNRGRLLVAQGTLLAFGFQLFGMADCSTALACFILGTGLMFATNLRSIRARPVRVHLLCSAIIVAGGVALLFGGTADVAQALGRKSTLSGRTEIWAAVIPAVSNPVIGDGFESFWIGPDVQKVWHSLSSWWSPKGLNEAHDGYIEVYANLGWIGVCLISLILIGGYRRAISAFRKNSHLGSLMLVYIIVAAVYSITEAGFRLCGPMWLFLLLAITSANGVSANLVSSQKPRTPVSPDDLARRTALPLASLPITDSQPQISEPMDWAGSTVHGRSRNLGARSGETG